MNDMMLEYWTVVMAEQYIITTPSHNTIVVVLLLYQLYNAASHAQLSDGYQAVNT